MPFGEDSNDLPVELIQHQFNENLLHLSSRLGPGVFSRSTGVVLCSKNLWKDNEPMTSDDFSMIMLMMLIMLHDVDR